MLATKRARELIGTIIRAKQVQVLIASHLMIIKEHKSSSCYRLWKLSPCNNFFNRYVTVLEASTANVVSYQCII